MSFLNKIKEKIECLKSNCCKKEVKKLDDKQCCVKIEDKPKEQTEVDKEN